MSDKNPKAGEPNPGDRIQFIADCDGRFKSGDIALVEKVTIDNIWLKDITNHTIREHSHGNILISYKYAIILPPEIPIKRRNRFELINE